MIKRILAVFLLLITLPAYSAFTDAKFGQYQVADSQWNVSACLTTNTCQIYSKNPGTMYKIPFTAGQWNWQPGQYVQFSLTGNPTNPYEGKVYNSNGSVAGSIGTGHIVNMGPDYFFFVGSDNNTGQLFSGSSGMNSNAGVQWTGTLNPTLSQVDSISSNYSDTPLGAGATYTGGQSLCCGGSSSPFSADSSKTAKIMSFMGRTTGDSKVLIEQIGVQNVTTVEQSGGSQNYASLNINGSSNTVAISQSSSYATQVNYTDIYINGNNNNISTTQQSTGGGKGIFLNVSDNNNTVHIQQKDNGSHWADVTLSGGNKTVNVLQQGSASHMTSINLSGQPQELVLSQSGSTQQFYSIHSNCATQGGCAAITVTQGN